VKKLIFLLIMALAFVGMVSAIGAAHPPGVYTPDTAISENSGYEAVVTSDTVLTAQGFSALPANFMAIPNTNDFAGKPQDYHIIKPVGVVEGRVLACNTPDYNLRL